MPLRVCPHEPQYNTEIENEKLNSSADEDKNQVEMFVGGGGDLRGHEGEAGGWLQRHVVLYLHACI